jgi:hypothetical protein
MIRISKIPVFCETKSNPVLKRGQYCQLYPCLKSSLNEKGFLYDYLLD